MKRWTRRNFIQGAGSALAAGLLSRPAAAAFEPARSTGKRVVVVGGGFGGAIVARILREDDPRIEVVLVTAATDFVACPGSNLSLAGLRPLDANRIDYRRLAEVHGVHVVVGTATAVDAVARTVTVGDTQIAYDRLVLSPGVDFRFADIAGYDAQTTPLLLPHAWKAGEQTLLLRRQLEAMPDGGAFVITVPKGPIRAPAGPYERACLVAGYFKRAKRNSRIIVLDENPEPLLKGKQFRKVWDDRFPIVIDYRPNQTIRGVVAEERLVLTEAGEVRGEVVNVIPPQMAGAIAHQAGVVGPDGRWCPVDPTTFESTRVPGIYVIGDACIGEPMPKTGFSANSQAKVCALNLVAALNGKRLIDPSSANVTYSFVDEAAAISFAAVYRVRDGRIEEITDGGGESAAATEIEWLMGLGWLDNILAEMAG